MPTPVDSALSKARQCTPRMVASFFCCSWAQCEFVHGLMPPSLKHLIGFRRDRREAVFLFLGDASINNRPPSGGWRSAL